MNEVLMELGDEYILEIVVIVLRVLENYLPPDLQSSEDQDMQSNSFSSFQIG
jgi:hypothetical protein